MDKKFTLGPLSDDDIAKHNIPIGELWMVKTPDNQVLGPFETTGLKDYADSDPEFFNEVHVYNLESEEWKLFYKAPQFQRRRPKLVPAQSLVQNDEFFVLEKGQKMGPFTLEQLQEKVEAKALPLTSEVSVDGGKSWIKLYEHHQFDRRLRYAQKDLPFTPQSELFDHVEEEMDANIFKIQNEKENEVAITGLAFIGRGNDKGQTLKQQQTSSEQQEDEEFSTKEDSSSFYQPLLDSKEFQKIDSMVKEALQKVNWKYVGASFLFLIIAFTGFNSFNNQFPSTDVEMQADNDPRSINNSDRGVNKREPASVQKTRPLRKVQRTEPARYEPVQRRPKQAQLKRPVRNKQRRRITHTMDDDSSININDPRIKEELTRELAGDYYEEQQPEYVEPNDQEMMEYDREYDDYEKVPQNGGGFYDEENPRGEMDNGDYPREESYPQDQQAPYEEYSDFE